MIEIVLTGIIYVFAILGLIVLFILLLSLITRGAGNRKVKEQKVAEVVKTSADWGEESELDPKVICAITAAIDAFERDGEGRRFKILSFRRVGRN